MPSLKEIQESFSEAIYNNKHKKLSSAILPTDIDNAERINIYKNNVMVTLYETLKRLYPSILKLVDEQFFKYATTEYTKENPSTSGNLDEYGENFIDFIANFLPAKDFKYLPDVARLEWALHKAYFAVDSEPIDRNSLSKIPQGKLEGIKFTLHPSANLISSPYPIDKIWAISQDGYKGDVNIDINERGADILVIRPEYKVETILLEDGEFVFLNELKNSKNLYQAFEKAVEINTDFNLGLTLQKFVLNGTLVDYHSKN